MAFAIYKNSTQLAQLIVLLIFSPLTILCLVLRFVATRRTKRKLGFEDWMAVLATIFAILNNLFALLAIGVLNGRQIIDEVKQSPQDYEAMRKYDIVSIYMFFGHIVTVKLSILAFYRRIFGIRVAYLRAIYTLGALQIIVTTIFIILQGFQCRPLARYWDLTVPGTCWPEITIIFGGSLPDSLIDFAVVILCMVMIKSLQISPQLKRRLRILFGIGFLVGIIGLIKMGVTYSTNPVFALSMVSIWTAIQMFFSILCACAPVYRPIMPTGTGWGQIWSRVTGSHGRSTRRHSGQRGSLDKSPLSKTKSTFDDGSSRNSTANLNWSAEAAHEPETHSMSDLHTTEGVTKPDGIHVRREYTVEGSPV